MPDIESDRPLDSWKHISAYLGCDERTVRRWEKERALPVHRPPGSGRRAVFAYKGEIDRWLKGQADMASSAGGVQRRGPSSPEIGQPSSASKRGSFAELTVPEEEPGPGTSGTGRHVSVPPGHAKSDIEDVAKGSGWRGLSLVAPGILALEGAVAILALVAIIGRSSASRAVTSNPPGFSSTDTSGVSSSAWKPEVLAVQFVGIPHDLGMYVNGLGFGHLAIRLPYTGVVPWFRIGDVSCFAMSPGTCEAGYTGDVLELRYLSWTDSQILFSHLKLAKPGDAIELSVWNPQAGDGQGAAVWGGNIPPIRPGTPQISSVFFSGTGKDLRITVLGKNFGKAPPGVPSVGNTSFFEIGDYAYHSSNVPLSTFFRAGYQNNAVVESILLIYRSWSDRKVEIEGFAGSYGQNGMLVHRGDPISIDIWNTRNHLATAWGGRIP